MTSIVVDDRNCERNADSVSSSDDTIFLDLPLPPVPQTVQAVRIHNMDTVNDKSETDSAAPTADDNVVRNRCLFARLQDFDADDDFRRAPRQTPERCSSSVSLASCSSDERRSDSMTTPTPPTTTTANPNGQSATSSMRWSSSDEDASFYRERLSLFRCSESADRGTSSRRSRRRSNGKLCSSLGNSCMD